MKQSISPSSEGGRMLGEGPINVADVQGRRVPAPSDWGIGRVYTFLAAQKAYRSWGAVGGGLWSSGVLIYNRESATLRRNAQ